MEWSSILKAFLEVGVLGICAVSMIYTHIRSNNKDQERLDKKDENLQKGTEKEENRVDSMLDNIQKQNLQFQQQIFDQLNKVTDSIVTHVPSVEENIKISKISEEIDACLKEILAETGADRADLVQFHNGGRGVNKQSFLKMSMTNEQVKLGVKPIMMEFKDQFRSVLAYFTKQICDTGRCDVPDIEAIKSVDTGMYEFMLSRDLQAKFGMAIHNEDKFTIGFVCIEFKDKNDVDLEKIHTSFHGKQQVIEKLLNL